MQKRAEEKAVIWAWFEAPFHLNFKRNKIFTLGSPGIIKDIGGFTIEDLADGQLLSDFFKKIGVQYVIWGYNETPKAPYGGTFELTQGLKALMATNNIIYDDGRRVMIVLD